MSHVLVDADILVYRVGYAAQSKGAEGEVVALPPGLACARARDTVEGILDCLSGQVDSFQLYLTSTDKSNYRNTIYPFYKANRTQPKPVNYDAIREYLDDTYGAIIVTGQEADDQIGIDNNRLGDCIICSIDKDLDQLPGKHYNFVKQLHYQVTPEEGLHFFYHQLLMGDRTDNIPGLTGIGQVKAEKALAKATSERHLFQVARTLYQKEFPDTWEEVMRRNGRLLKIRQHEGELWDFPSEEQPDETEPQAVSEAV